MRLNCRDKSGVVTDICSRAIEHKYAENYSDAMIFLIKEGYKSCTKRQLWTRTVQIEEKLNNDERDRIIKEFHQNSRKNYTVSNFRKSLIKQCIHNNSTKMIKEGMEFISHVYELSKDTEEKRELKKLINMKPRCIDKLKRSLRIIFSNSNIVPQQVVFWSIDDIHNKSKVLIETESVYNPKSQEDVKKLRKMDAKEGNF